MSMAEVAVLYMKFRKKVIFFKLFRSIVNAKKTILCILNLRTFFCVVATFFDEVPTSRFGRLTQKRPEIAQSARELALCSFVGHVPLLCSVTRARERDWLASLSEAV
jgi:hypothetical protein